MHWLIAKKNVAKTPTENALIVFCYLQKIAVVEFVLRQPASFRRRTSPGVYKITLNVHGLYAYLIALLSTSLTSTLVKINHVSALTWASTMERIPPIPSWVSFVVQPCLPLSHQVVIPWRWSFDLWHQRKEKEKVSEHIMILVMLRTLLELNHISGSINNIRLRTNLFCMETNFPSIRTPEGQNEQRPKRTKAKTNEGQNERRPKWTKATEN